MSRTKPSSRKESEAQEQAASQRKFYPPVFAPASSLFTPYRPAVRATLGAQQAVAASRRDEALVAWLASQPDTDGNVDDFDADEMWKSEDASESDDVYTDSIEQVFAQLANN